MPPCFRGGRQLNAVKLHKLLSLTDMRLRNSLQAAVLGGMAQ